MKRKVISIGIIGAILFAPMLVSAESSATGTRLRQGGPKMASGTKQLPPRLEEQIERREERRERMINSSTSQKCITGDDGQTKCLGDDRKEEMREKMTEKRGEILKRMSEKAIERMEAAIERLTKLTERLNSRITKLKEKGVDTTTAEAKIIIAKSKLTDAKTAVENAKGLVATAILNANSATSTNQGDHGKPIREALAKAKEAIMNAHKALVEAVASLQASGKERGEPRNGGTGSSTTSTTTSGTN